MNKVNNKIELENSNQFKNRWPIVLADDHALVRDALSEYLSHTGNFHVDSFENLPDALSALRSETHYEIALIDLVMPGMDGIGTLESYIADFPDVKFVIISGSTSIALMRRAISIGAMGFIPKTISMKSIPSILRMIIDGERFLPYNSSRIDQNSINPKSYVKNSSEHVLLPIETQIIGLVAEGRTNKEIGWSVGITEILVKMHMRNLCKKLDAKNRAHAVMAARQLGIL